MLDIIHTIKGMTLYCSIMLFMVKYWPIGFGLNNICLDTLYIKLWSDSSENMLKCLFIYFSHWMWISVSIVTSNHAFNKVK